MFLVKDKVFQNLDAHLDIERFLSLELDFYDLFSRNLEKGNPTWTAGNIPFDTKSQFLKNNRFVYYYKHNKDHNFESDNKDEVSIYHQLRYNAFNPYRILHLFKPDTEYLDFVKSYKRIYEWFKSLPFERTDSASIFFNNKYVPLGFHADYNYFPVEDGGWTPTPDTAQDLIWFRFNLDRKFYIYRLDDNHDPVEQWPVEGRSVWFNHFNWHGCIDPSAFTSITIKLEGKFFDDFKNKI